MSDDVFDVLVVGAGVAGLSCARAAGAAGLQVQLLDKGRGPGGRASTRRVETPRGPLSFDHGAQFFTVRDGAFAAALAPLRAAGQVAVWDGRIAHDGVIEPAGAAERLVGVPGMNALVRGLAEGLNVRWGLEVTGLRRTGGQWQALGADGAVLGTGRAVVVAIPAEQAARLLQMADPDQAAEAAACVTAPTWAVMAAFDVPLGTPYAALKSSTGPLAWAARQPTKPGRSSEEAWVLHASQAASRALLEQPAEDVTRQLLEAFAAVTGHSATPYWAMAHRWRYAFVEVPAGQPFGWSAALQVGSCGDWRIGPRIEAAFVSGHGLGTALVTALAQPQEA